LDRGLYFESNIPQGYGVGSSGALIAAIYKEYCQKPLNVNGDSSNIRSLKEIFSVMESYFHGTSSGMDPLNCYIGKPLLFESRENVNLVKVPHTKNNADGAIFLLNSGYAGATEPLVKLFLKKSEDLEFKKQIQDFLIPSTNSSIERLITGDILGFFDGLYELSTFQFEFMREMIPESFITIWKRGLETGEYYLKLCGSGGGGFLLGFTRDYKLAENLMKNSGVDIIPVFKNSNFKR
jgi:mevalonate kinase